MTTTVASNSTSGLVPFSQEKLRETLAGSRNPEETLSKLVHAIQQRLKTDVCSVYLLEQNRSHLVLAATVGLRGVCGWHCTRGSPVWSRSNYGPSPLKTQ